MQEYECEMNLEISCQPSDLLMLAQPSFSDCTSNVCD
uniref:Uncharacterized protein n=1 Tax=Anguilla anguilla TaxID=7936 RepID=A0A0E9WH05_ANGAN